jgi:hypothetical protein
MVVDDVPVKILAARWGAILAEDSGIQLPVYRIGVSLNAAVELLGVALILVWASCRPTTKSSCLCPALPQPT